MRLGTPWPCPTLPPSPTRCARRAASTSTTSAATELAESALHDARRARLRADLLREIAQNSPYSHGVVHYYFADKVELITYCVRQYKAQCVHALRRDRRDLARPAEELATRFADEAGRDAWSTRPRCTGSGTTCAPSRCSSVLREDVARDRRHARADDLAGRHPLRRARRQAAARARLRRRPTACSTGSSPRRCCSGRPGPPRPARTTLSVLTARVDALMPSLLA